MADLPRERLAALAEALADYRRGEIPPLGPEQVDRWLDQFPEADRPVLLEELESVFQRTYFSRQRVKELLRTFLREYLIGEEPPESALSRVRYLNLQAPRSSQRAYLRLADEVLREETGLGVRQCGRGEASVFVYLDDAIYTGNRLRQDLAGEAEGLAPGWLRRAAPSGCTLWIYCTGCHSAGWRYAVNHLRPAAEERGIRFRLVPGHVFENERSEPQRYECLWPEESASDPEVEQYASRLREERAARGFSDRLLFREPGIPHVETLFTSAEGRSVVEGAFLRAGARLARTFVRQQHLRPLGFEVLETLGFGTLCVTYLNIANNCPLALWWSAPGRWTPLLPRRASGKGP